MRQLSEIRNLYHKIGEFDLFNANLKVSSFVAVILQILQVSRKWHVVVKGLVYMDIKVQPERHLTEVARGSP